MLAAHAQAGRMGRPWSWNHIKEYSLSRPHKVLRKLLLKAGCACTGSVHGTSWELEQARGNCVMAMLTLAVICTVSSLQVFGKDRLIFWRESASGKLPRPPSPLDLDTP